MHTTYNAIELMSKTNGGRGGTVANVSSVAGLDYLFSAPAYAYMQLVKKMVLLDLHVVLA